MTALIIAKNTTYSLIKNLLALFEKNQFNLIKKQQTNEANKKLSLNKEWKIQIGIPGSVANRKYSSNLLLSGWVKQLYEILRLEARIRYQLLKKLRRIWFFLKLRKYREKFKFFRSRYNKFEIEYPKEEQISINEALAKEKLIMEKYKELNAIKLSICNLIKITTEKMQEYEQLLEQHAKENTSVNQINAHMIAQAVRVNGEKNNLTIDEEILKNHLINIDLNVDDLKAKGINLPLGKDPYAIQQIDIAITKQQYLLQQIEALSFISNWNNEQAPFSLRERINLLNACTNGLFIPQTAAKITSIKCQKEKLTKLDNVLKQLKMEVNYLKTKALSIESTINQLEDYPISEKANTTQDDFTLKYNTYF